MKFSNVRLLVKDFAKCFKFYSEQLGLEPAWGDENSGYASFKVAEGIEGFALFVSDWMAPSVGMQIKNCLSDFGRNHLYHSVWIMLTTPMQL
jgi:catechol 2,3-dioxygenase-like lactoylglutathione lyase family enzyme